MLVSKVFYNTMSNESTKSKSQEQISSGEYKLCIHKRTQQGTIIVFYRLFILTTYGPYYNCVSYPNVHALSSCPLVICLIFYYSFTMHLPQGQYAIYMCSDIILLTLLLISVVHAYTMCIP